MQLHRRSTLYDWKNIYKLINPFNKSNSTSQSNSSNTTLNDKNSNSNSTCLMPSQTIIPYDNGKHQPMLSNEDIFQLLQEQDKYDTDTDLSEYISSEAESNDDSKHNSSSDESSGNSATYDSNDCNYTPKPSMKINITITKADSESNESSSDETFFSLDSSEWDDIVDDIDASEHNNNNDNDIFPYTPNDYLDIHEINSFENEYKNNFDVINENNMNWSDKESVGKIRDLLSDLLFVASTHIGIREDELYLMFSTPTPESIIQHLRFGLLSDLCTVKLDRFGRRSYLYFEENKQQKKEESKHVFSGSRLPTQLDLLVQRNVNDLHLFMADSTR
eukprot:291474_1